MSDLLFTYFVQEIFQKVSQLLDLIHEILLAEQLPGSISRVDYLPGPPLDLPPADKGKAVCLCGLSTELALSWILP